jgi:DNA-binding LytR/AlgR family response regulator
LLVDDERPARERLARLLAAIPGVDVVGEAGDGRTALERVGALRPDVVFLDIDMPELDGLAVAAALGPDGPSVVFVTAYDEFALAAFDAHAVDYVVKPVERPRLERAVARLRERRRPDAVAAALRDLAARQAAQRFAVKCGVRYVVFNVGSVSAVVARDHYAEIVHAAGRTLADDSLEALERRLDAERFLRIHRSSIINLDYLREMRREGDRKYVAVLSDVALTELPVSRESLEVVKRRLGLE